MPDFHRGRGRGNSLDFDNRQHVFRQGRIRNEQLHIGFENHAGAFTPATRQHIMRQVQQTFGISVVEGRRHRSTRHDHGHDVLLMSGSQQAMHDSVSADPARWGGNPAGNFAQRMVRKMERARLLAGRFLRGAARGHTNRERRVAAAANFDMNSDRTAVHEIGHAMNLDHPALNNFDNIMQPTVTGHQTFQATVQQQQDALSFVQRRTRTRSF